MMEHVRCYLCGSDEYEILYRSNVDSKDVTVAHYACTNVRLAQHGQIVRCRSCGLAYNNPRVRAERLRASYERVADPVYIEEREGRKLTFRNNLAELEEYKKGGRLLDVGCYAGLFLAEARQNGWEVYGIEPSRWACQYAKERMELHNIRAGTVSDVDFPAEHFDVITMWDVIEHLVDPVGDLRKIAGWLKKDGLLCFTTHNLNSFPARVLKSRYPFLMVMHVVHFTPVTLEKLLEKAGLRIVKMTPHRRTISLRYFLDRLASYNRVIYKMANAALRLLGIRRSFITIRLAGLIAVYAKK